jgi:hypothetical protein
MKAAHGKYLESIGLTSETIKRHVGRVIDHAEQLSGQEIIGIFVNDYYDESGSREYESLWLTSEQYLCEVRNFRKTGEYDIDVSPIKKNIMYFRIWTRDYEFESSTKKSRITMECVNRNDTSFQLKAADDNCEKLVKFINSYVKPNMI